MTTPDGALPASTRRYLADASLSPLWAAARAKLEGGQLAPIGTITVSLDEAGAQQLAGLLGAGAKVNPGRVRVRLDILDIALRRSAAQAGLVAVLAQLTGPLSDRAAARDAARQQSDAVWAQLDAVLAVAGLADAPWVPTFLNAARRAGILTRAGTADATAAIRCTGGVLAALGVEVAFSGDVVEPRWELAALASAGTGDAHGLDHGRLAAALVLRMAAAALNVPVPRRAPDRRLLWAQLGVTADMVSGTVLVWALRPPGDDAWSTMLRARADLGLVTHLTVHELNAAGDVPLIGTHSTVFACENPQILQAAARDQTTAPLICLSGNPASAGWLLVRRLLAREVRVAYHGDFDWPGVDIARRLYALGAQPWRMSAVDYSAAVREAAAEYPLILSGKPGLTPWDEDLAAIMGNVGVTVHEESLLPVLLNDLRVGTRRTVSGTLTDRSRSTP